MAEIADLAVPVGSALAGGGGVLWVSKLLIQSWLEKYDKALDTIRDLDKQVAVQESVIKTMQRDIDGLGNLIRKKPTAPE